MPLQNDLTLNVSKFDPSRITSENTKFNEHLIKVMEGMPKWFEVGAARYREMRWNNETPLPRPPVIETGRNETVPSRDAGRKIPVRIFLPDAGKPKGVFMHIHGGGYVLQSEAYQDGLLNFMAQKASLAVVSIGYRLAPEHPFPAGPNDCYDAVEYLVRNSESRFGAPLLFVGGESAGGHFSLLTFLHLRKAIPSFYFRALILHFGIYDVSFLPAARHFPRALIIDHTIMEAYRNAFLPNSTIKEWQDPSVSPFFADWPKIAQEMEGGLPPALFTIGTEDPLVDDSVLMAAKWGIAGGEATLKVYNGAPHGFNFFDAKVLPAAGESMKDLEQYLLEKLA